MTAQQLSVMLSRLEDKEVVIKLSNDLGHIDIRDIQIGCDEDCGLAFIVPSIPLTKGEKQMVQFYIGRFTEEQFLFGQETNIIPRHGDLIYYEDEIYKVKRTMFDYQFNGIYVFLEIANEEDF